MTFLKPILRYVQVKRTLNQALIVLPTASTSRLNTLQLKRQFSSHQVDVSSAEWRQADSMSQRVKKIDTKFIDSSGTAFRHKTLRELFRALIVLSLCSSDWLVNNNQKLMKVARATLGSGLYEKLMMLTFYGQFVIGKEERTVCPIIERYLKDGVGPILYFALEEDKSESNSLSNDVFYAQNVQAFKDAVDITAKATGGSGYIAVKPTALSSPKLWAKMTEVIVRQTEEVTPDLYHTHSNLICKEHERALTGHELKELDKLMGRAEDIIQYAANAGVKVMIDAEKTYFQPAIQRFLGVEMMRRFNKDSSVVLVTYQTYLKAALNNIARDLEYCKRENIKFGARIVRGAYLDQERLLAKQHGYEDPTNASFEETSEMYNSTAQYLLEEMAEGIDMDVMFATHNEDTLRYIIHAMSQHSCLDSNISFGQLYGMCEHITFHLGQVGIPVYKSMPYGATELVSSYLGRRAVENRGVLDKVKKERQLLTREIKRRLLRKSV